jgi:hypothetical protein
MLAGVNGGEGKSMLVKPILFNVFPLDGIIFAKPGNGNYPSLEVPSAMAAFLDEWRWDSDVAGCAVIVVRRQRGTYRPTTKPNDSQSGRPYDVDASMSLRTLK